MISADRCRTRELAVLHDPARSWSWCRSASSAATAAGDRRALDVRGDVELDAGEAARVDAVLLDSVTSVRSGISISRESRRATLSCEYVVPMRTRPVGVAAGVAPGCSGTFGGAVRFSVVIVTSSGTTSENSRRMRSHAIRVDIAPETACKTGRLLAGHRRDRDDRPRQLRHLVHRPLDQRELAELDPRGTQLLLRGARARVRDEEAEGQRDQHDEADRRADDDRRILVADALRLPGVLGEKVDGTHRASPRSRARSRRRTSRCRRSWRRASRPSGARAGCRRAPCTPISRSSSSARPGICAVPPVMAISPMPRLPGWFW